MVRLSAKDASTTTSSDTIALSTLRSHDILEDEEEDDSFEIGPGESLLGNETKSPPLSSHGHIDNSVDTTALQALHTNDDPSLNPWTFRMFFLGIGLSAFGSALATIFLFKPQSATVSVMFSAVISYVAGNAMSMYLPRSGHIGQWLNPHTFNSKEHLAIIVMSGSASGAAFATEVLATQKLYYDVVPGALVAIMLTISSQLIGYGMAGALRESLVYPTNMLWPSVLPLNSLIQTLHSGKADKKFNFFWIIFGIVAVWELLPQYVMPILTGVSVFCFTKRNSLVFTNIFGGTSGNEGLGLLSLCFDWQYITTSSLFLPLVTLTNAFMGFLICIALFLGVYYGNAWQAQAFPFLSQQLFSATSTSTLYVAYNQSAILDQNNELDPSLLEAAGLPSFAATYASYLLTTSLGITASVAHVLLFNTSAISKVFRLPTLPRAGRNTSQAENPQKLDPHYLKMLQYKEVPTWWYVLIGLLSMVTGLACTYTLKSTLPWWGFSIACLLSFASTLFMGALSGVTGFDVPMSSVVQLLSGYIHPGKPVANMYFVLFGSNSQTQALSLIQNLKLGQYGKLSPRCTFTVQILGTVLGAMINYFLMNSITTNQRELLLSIQGTNVWSGQAIQSFNSNAIAFGALSRYMFSIGQKYAWIVLALPVGFLIPLPVYFLHWRWPSYGFDNITTPVIVWYSGYLAGGINSSVMVYFVIGFFFQYYIRKYYPDWFFKYNYILAAAIAGGTECLVFFTTFTVQGAIGKEVPFPPYWGNNYNSGNFDYCARDPGLHQAG